jgi:curved DNA-binding protein CbpA
MSFGMNGQLSEHPLAELIDEISAKSLSGRLQVQHDRVRVAIYFEDGKLLYAASNARNLRLREFLLQAGVVEGALARYGQRRPDLELVKALCADQVLPAARAEQIQTKQVTDIVRLALSWIEGTWDFDPRARLDDPPQLKLDTDSLLLALGGFVQRENRKYVLGGKPALRAPAPAQPAPVAPVEEKRDEIADAHSFLEQLGKAQTHYDVLDVSRESTGEQMKFKYYELARRYHPDRFRRAEAGLVRRLESAFARVTQAYDTLKDDRLRAGYDAKLLARQKAQQLAESAPKPTRPAPEEKPAPATETVREAKLSHAERAEQQFKEGYAAFESGQKKVALGLFASAANAFPKEARYRAFYGRVLAEHEDTRRAAEAELQAAVKLDPKNAEYRVMLAELYRDLGLMLRARGEAERAVAADPNNHKARDLLRALKSV